MVYAFQTPPIQVKQSLINNCNNTSKILCTVNDLKGNIFIFSFQARSSPWAGMQSGFLRTKRVSAHEQTPLSQNHSPKAPPKPRGHRGVAGSSQGQRPAKHSWAPALGEVQTGGHQGQHGECRGCSSLHCSCTRALTGELSSREMQRHGIRQAIQKPQTLNEGNNTEELRKGQY